MYFVNVLGNGSQWGGVIYKVGSPLKHDQLITCLDLETSLPCRTEKVLGNRGRVDMMNIH